MFEFPTLANLPRQFTLSAASGMIELEAVAWLLREGCLPALKPLENERLNAWFSRAWNAMLEPFDLRHLSFDFDFLRDHGHELTASLTMNAMTYVSLRPLCEVSGMPELVASLIGHLATSFLPQFTPASALEHIEVWHQGEYDNPQDMLTDMRSRLADEREVETETLTDEEVLEYANANILTEQRLAHIPEALRKYDVISLETARVQLHTLPSDNAACNVLEHLYALALAQSQLNPLTDALSSEIIHTEDCGEMPISVCFHYGENEASDASDEIVLEMLHEFDHNMAQNGYSENWLARLETEYRLDLDALESLKAFINHGLPAVARLDQAIDLMLKFNQKHWGRS